MPGGKFDRLTAVARELVALAPAVIVTANPYSTRAVRENSSAVPIVVALDYETDPGGERMDHEPGAARHERDRS